MDISKFILDNKKIIDNNIEDYFKSLKKHNPTLYNAMRYSVLNGGKRLRPILCIATAKCFNTNIKKVLPSALAIEFFHCSTLVHDDLPCMDNDFLRRGHPTCHIKFGEANAILAGDALIIESFKIFAKYNNKIITEFSDSVGAQGVIAGQVSDLSAEDQEASEELLKYIHINKTAKLIRASVKIGALVSNASAEQINKLSSYGEKIGLAFQIKDDILDKLSSSHKIGKSVNSDTTKGKMTYPSVYGLKKSEVIMKELVNESIDDINSLDIDTKILEKIARYVIEREN